MRRGSERYVALAGEAVRRSYISSHFVEALGHLIVHGETREVKKPFERVRQIFDLNWTTSTTEEEQFAQFTIKEEDYKKRNVLADPSVSVCTAC